MAKLLLFEAVRVKYGARGGKRSIVERVQARDKEEARRLLGWTGPYTLREIKSQRRRPRTPRFYYRDEETAA